MIDLTLIDWQKCNGLIPAVIQDVRDSSVLMLGYMSEAAVVTTEETGKVTFYSRSKKRLWTKGESSGHFLLLKDMKLDCDQDTLLIQAEPQGPTCHTGSETCFGDKPGSLAFLARLQDIIKQRKDEPTHGSYTNKLLQSGLNRMAQKVGEEAIELALAAINLSDEELLGEASDLIFHLMVLLRARDLSLTDVAQVLQQRHQEKT